MTHKSRKDGHTENLGGRYQPGENGPHKKPTAPTPLLLWDKV